MEQLALDEECLRDDDDVGGAASPQPSLSLGDEVQFPTLGGAGRRPTGVASPSLRANPASSLATKLASQLLAQAFPVLSAAEIARFVAHSDGSTQRAADAIRATYGLSPLPGILGGALTVKASAAAAGSTTHAGHAARCRAHESVARRIAESLAWVSTGHAVAALYDSTRGDASALARARNAAFDRATRAYLSGDGAAAAALSRQGRELDQKMREAHARAAADIFAQRNATRTGSSGSGCGRSSGGGGDASVPGAGSIVHVDVGAGARAVVRVLDLHGLHPGEAVAAAEAALESHAPGAASSASNNSGHRVEWVALVAGARHHAKKMGRGGGSVAAAVERTLAQLSRAGGRSCEWYDAGAGVFVVRVA
jgi:hypothetical protein